MLRILSILSILLPLALAAGCSKSTPPTPPAATSVPAADPTTGKIWSAADAKADRADYNQGVMDRAKAYHEPPSVILMQDQKRWNQAPTGQ